jgi:hypothetical protein
MLDNFCIAARVVGWSLTGLAFVGLCFAFVTWTSPCSADDWKPFAVMLPIWLVCLCLAIGSLFIPTTKQMCVIKVLPVIANNEDVQKLPDKVVDLANDWLDELKPKKEIKETSDE